MIIDNRFYRYESIFGYRLRALIETHGTWSIFIEIHWNPPKPVSIGLLKPVETHKTWSVQVHCNPLNLVQVYWNPLKICCEGNGQRAEQETHWLNNRLPHSRSPFAWYFRIEQIRENCTKFVMSSEPVLWKFALC